MSWDKNTINYSTLDSIRELLLELGINYELSTLGVVQGRGLNDDEMYGGRKNGAKYELRRLEYKDKVVLEQIVQDADCDVDDGIFSHKFNHSEEPKDWQFLVKTDVCGDYCEND